MMRNFTLWFKTWKIYILNFIQFQNINKLQQQWFMCTNTLKFGTLWLRKIKIFPHTSREEYSVKETSQFSIHNEHMQPVTCTAEKKTEESFFFYLDSEKSNARKELIVLSRYVTTMIATHLELPVPENYSSYYFAKPENSSLNLPIRFCFFNFDNLYYMDKT